MIEPQPPLVSRLSVEGKQNGEKHRTLKDTLLISAWVAAYAFVLIAFRAAKALESVSSNKRGH